MLFSVNTHIGVPWVNVGEWALVETNVKQFVLESAKEGEFA